MKYLLDTHTIIWYLEDLPKIPLKTKEIIELSDNDIYICSVSLWEIVIKMNLGKLKLSLSLDELFTAIKNSDISILQIENEYMKKLSLLPDIHKDPFDRLVIATALAEDLTIITTDENIHKYDVSWVW